jgi:hypothetical protein
MPWTTLNRAINSNVVLDVFMARAREDLGCRFEVDVPLTDDVKRILFGPEKTQIWPVVTHSGQPNYSN